MKLLHNERGIALAMVLVLSVVLLAVITALIFMATARTQFAGMQKRYYTALEAGKGGQDLAYQIITRGVAGENTSSTTAVNLILSKLSSLSAVVSPLSGCSATSLLTGAAYTGLAAKLNASSTDWSGCNSSLTINPADNSTYDMKFDFTGAGPNQTYRAFVKIVDTIEGNSAPGGATYKKAYGVVNPGEINVVPQRYLYTVEIEAENPANTAERARLSVLYEY